MFFKSTISSIVGDLESKIGKLIKLAEKHDESSLIHATLADAATKMSEQHKSDADRARRIADKVKAILD